MQHINIWLAPAFAESINGQLDPRDQWRLCIHSVVSPWWKGSVAFHSSWAWLWWHAGCWIGG